MFNLFKKNKKIKSPQDAISKEIKSEEIKKDVDDGNTPTEFEKAVIDADNGSISSATYVGMSYSYGIEKGKKQHPPGVARNSELAIKYLTIAAEKGFLKAQVELGMLYQSLDKYSEEGFRWYSLAAKRGDAYSQMLLAACYRYGVVVDEDDNKYYQWCLESACNGNVVAMNYLGEYYNERSVKLLNRKDCRDEAWIYAKLGHKWCKLAADAGIEKSMYYTGVSYFFGFGTEVDKKKALTYIDLAIAKGDSSAIEFKRENMS